MALCSTCENGWRVGCVWPCISSCGEFCKGVCGADHCPLALNLGGAAEEELSEASGMLDVSEDRFDGVFALSVSALVPALARPGAHCPHQGTAFPAAVGFAGAACGHKSARRAVDQALEVCF